MCYIVYLDYVRRMAKFVITIDKMTTMSFFETIVVAISGDGLTRARLGQGRADVTIVVEPDLAGSYTRS